MAKVPSDKVAVVDHVKAQAASTSTAVVTEYRGLTVAEISSLRRALRQAGADYKVQKNTLVRRAVAGTESESLSEFLEGPTAIAWIKGDISAVAKILREFAKASPTLVVKGGVLDGKALSAKDLFALAELPSREVLLSQLAGLMAAPMRQMASLLKAVPLNFAYGLSALIDAKGGPVAVATSETEAPVDAAEAAEATDVVEVTEASGETDESEGAPAEAVDSAEEVDADEAPSTDDTPEPATADADAAE